MEKLYIYMSVILFIISWAVAFTVCSFIHIILFIFLVNALIVALAIRNFLKCAGIGKLLFTVNIQKKLHSFLVFNFLSNFSLLIWFFLLVFFFLFSFSAEMMGNSELSPEVDVNSLDALISQSVVDQLLSKYMSTLTVSNNSAKAHLDEFLSSLVPQCCSSIRENCDKCESNTITFMKMLISYV